MPRRRNLPRAPIATTLDRVTGAVIYIRVSTKEQVENLSLPTQLDACEKYCRREGSKCWSGSAKKARAPRRLIAHSFGSSSSTAG
jgi:DNA invertase Pin-like site-specific DNA recombinase